MPARRASLVAPRPLAALITGGVLTVSLAGCGGEEVAQVSAAEVGRSTVTEVVEAPATVAAKASARVAAPADGTVISLAVKDGQRVQAGQVLLQVHSPQAQDSLEQARAADQEAASTGNTGVSKVNTSRARSRDAQAGRAFAIARQNAEAVPDPTAREQALAALRSSEAQYRAESRQALGAASSFNQGVDALRSGLAAVSEAQRVQTRAAIAGAERTVSALVVRAPIAGVVSFAAPDTGGQAAPAEGLAELPQAVQGQAGSLLGGAAAGGGAPAVSGPLAVGLPVSTGAPLLTVTDTSSLVLTAEVDETDVLLVKPGVPAEVELDAVPGATYAATVSAIDPSPTTSSRGGVTYGVRLSLARGTGADGSPAPEPRPGMSATADLTVRAAPDAVAVPVSAVFRDGRRDAVWVVGDGVARKRHVTLGAQGEETVEVAEGLRTGERVVVKGADTVTDGQQVP